MYWNNPLIEVHWPSDRDPIKQSFHNGQHCLFWNPTAEFGHISTNQRLADLCKWATEWLSQDGLDNFVADPRNHYDIANLVKLNMWIHDIRQQGIVKPWLIQDQGDGTFIAGTGDSRLRCLERIPEIKTVPAFVSAHVDRAHLYSDLEPVTSFDQFARLCNARVGQTFLFRLTDKHAAYGLYWYEYNSDKTRSVTPGEAEAVTMFQNYYRKNPGVAIVPEWFDSAIAWQHHRSNN